MFIVKLETFVFVSCSNFIYLLKLNIVDDFAKMSKMIFYFIIYKVNYNILLKILKNMPKYKI